jgi:uncharacterized protein DUF6600
MMKMRLWGIGILLVGCAAAIGCVTTYPYHETVSMGQPSPTAEPAGGSDEPFYDDLAPYGRWVYVSGPGWVWSPSGVQAEWRPYQQGHWVFTDYGWTWASDEQWGWAVYHYGRWHQDPSYGWVWAPGTEWGPAWVAWHEGGGYVGWAPLPWQVRVQAGVGLDWTSVNVTIAPSSWSFTNARYLVDPGLRGRIVPVSRNVNLIQVTKNVTNYTYIDNRVYNQGVRVETIGRAAGHTIPRYHVSESDDTQATRGGKVRGNDFVLFRHDPPRGRKSQGRTDPPGHDEDRYRPRDFRAGDARPEPGPPPSQTAPAQQPPPAAPPEPPTTNRGQETRDHGHEAHPSRGRRFLDDMIGKQPPRRSPQDTPPPAPPTASGAPGQPPTPTNQPSAPFNPPSGTRPGNPPPGDQHGATTPPGRSEPPKGQVGKDNANERAKTAREAAARGRKPKQDAPKEDPAKPDEKKDKPDPNP